MQFRWSWTYEFVEFHWAIDNEYWSRFAEEISASVEKKIHKTKTGLAQTPSTILLHIPCIVKCIEQLLIANSLYSLLLTNTHTWQCQSNQDCCSRNCLSFSYKCIRERTEQPELPSHGNNQQPESPISGSASAGTAGSVQELVDRFGSDDGPDVNAAIPQRPSDSNAFVAPFRPPQQPDTQAPINIQGNRPCLTTGGNVWTRPNQWYTLISPKTQSLFSGFTRYSVCNLANVVRGNAHASPINASLATSNCSSCHSHDR